MVAVKSDIVHVALNTQDLDSDETARDNLAAAIASMGPTSPLALANSGIMTQVTLVGTTYTAYKAAVAKAGASGKQHETDVEAAVSARVLSNKSLRLLASLLEDTATTPAQVNLVGMDAYTGRPAEPALVAPLVDVKLGTKGSGKATALAHETGSTRYSYNAQMSPNPLGTTSTWTDLIGGGKTRKLTGPSGTSVWVRFALRRGQTQSDWSTPILVTFP
jgi:hypothetical protein